MPTIDVQSFSEQQKQKDLMKESNKALEATKEVKPKQEEPKQVQEPVVKEEVVKEEPVKELPSMDNKEEDHPTDFEYEEIKNFSDWYDFTPESEGKKTLMERLTGLPDSYQLNYSPMLNNVHYEVERGFFGKSYDVARDVAAGIVEGGIQTAKIPSQLAVWGGTALLMFKNKTTQSLGQSMVNWGNNAMLNIDYFLDEFSPFDANRGSISYTVGNVLSDVATANVATKAVSKGLTAINKEDIKYAAQLKAFQETSGTNIAAQLSKTPEQIKEYRNYVSAIEKQYKSNLALLSEVPTTTMASKFKRIATAIDQTPVATIMAKDVGSMMEERLKQYRDESGAIDFVEFIKDAPDNFLATTVYGTAAYITELKFGLGKILEKAKTPAGQLTLDAVQSLSKSTGFLSEAAKKNAAWTYVKLSFLKEGGTEIAQEAEQMATEWLFKLREKNPNDGTLEYRAKTLKENLTRLGIAGVIGGGMGGTFSAVSVHNARKEFSNTYADFLSVLKPEMTREDAIKEGKSKFDNNYGKIAPWFAREMEVQQDFTAGSGKAFEEFSDFISQAVKNPEWDNNPDLKAKDVSAMATFYSDKLYKLCSDYGLPMADWEDHISLRQYVADNGVISLQFLYDDKPLYQSVVKEPHKELVTGKENLEIGDEELNNWEEVDTSKLDAKTQQALAEKGIKKNKLWVKKGSTDIPNDIAPVEIENKLDKIKVGDKISIDKLDFDAKLVESKGANGFYDYQLSAILINPSKANYTTLSHEFGHFFFDTMYTAYRNNLLSDKMKGDFTGLLASMNINPNGGSHLKPRQAEALANLFSAYNEGAVLKGDVTSVNRKAVDGVYKAYKEDAYKAWKQVNQPNVVVSPATIEFMRKVIGNDIGEIRANVSNKVDIPAGMSKEEYAREKVAEINPELVTNEAGEDVSFAHPMATTNPDSRTSKVYTKTLTSLGFDLEANPELNLYYTKMNLAEQAAMATNMVENNPDSVKNMIYSNKFPQGINPNALMTAYQNYLFEKGKFKEANDMLSYRSMYLTEAGQTIAFEKLAQLGKDNINTKEYWRSIINDLLYRRGMDRINNLRFKNKFESTKDFMAWRNTTLRTATQNVIDGKLTISEALDKLTKDAMVTGYFQSNEFNEFKRELETAYKAGKLNDFGNLYMKMGEFFDKRLNIEIDDSTRQKLENKITDLQGTFDSSFDGKTITVEQARKLKELGDAIDALYPASGLSIATSTIPRLAMLSNPSTFITNLVSNFFMANSEAVVRRIRNMRLTGYVSSESMNRFMAHSSEIFDICGVTLCTAKPSDLTGKDKIKGERSASLVGRSKLITVPSDIIFKWALGAPDAWFKTTAFNDTANLEISRYVDKQLPNGSISAKQKMAEELYADVISLEPSSDIAKLIREHASLSAAEVTFTNKSKLNDFLGSARRYLNSASGDINLGDLLIPFLATPANVVSMGLDYSGLGVGINFATHFKQLMYEWSTAKTDANGNPVFKPATREFMNKLVRGGVGFILTALIAAFLDDDDYIPPYESCSLNEREYVKSINGTYNSIKIGGRYVSVDYLGPLGVPLAGIMMMKREKNVFGYPAAWLQQISQLPVIDFISEANNLANTYKGDYERGKQEIFDKIVNGAFARYYPNVFNTISDITMNSYERETKGLDVIDRIIGKINPNTLPKRQSFITGGDIERGAESKIWKLVAGGRVKIGLTSDTEAALSNLYVAGNMPYLGDFTNRGHFKDYSPEKKQEAREKFAKIFKEEADKLVKSNYFLKASSEEQKNMISKLRSGILKGL